MRPAMIYFEDLEVGAETYFGSYEVTREEVLEFARKVRSRSRSICPTRKPRRPTSAGSRRAAGTRRR